MSRFFSFTALSYFLMSSAFFLGCSSKGKDKEKSISKDANVIPVSGIVVHYQTYNDRIDIMGTILANERVDLRSEINGKVIGIYFQEGTRVRKGQRLIKIYDTDLRAQLRKVQLQRELADRELERKKKLLEVKGISMEELDIAANQASTLQADADLIEAQLKKTEIIAPFDGIVGLRYISEGEIVSPATTIATLQQIDPIKIEFDIPEKYSPLVVPGSKIEFEVNGGDKVFYGSVYATEPLIDVNTRTLKVRARAENKSLTLRPGSFIKIELLLKKDLKAIMIPTEAVVPGASSQKVFIYENGIALSRKIVTGPRNERDIQVTEGLSVEDTVITSGTMQLKDSVKVNLKLIKKDTL